MPESPDREWLRPETIPAQAPAGMDRAAMYELRPLSLGEILDRTFALYRSRFWLFASISAVSASVHVVVQAISLTTAHAMMRSLPLAPRQILFPPPPHAHLLGVLAARTHGASPIPSMHAFMVAQVGTWVAALIFFLVTAVTQAATSLALSQVYLNQPAGAKAALTEAFRRWYRWIGIALWLAWSLVYIPLLLLLPGLLLVGFGARSNTSALTVVGGVLIFVALLGGFPAGVVLYLRNTLAIPAAVVERLTVRPAMRRSKGLAAGTKGRIFVVLLIAACLYWVVAVLQSPASILIMLAPEKQHYLAQAIALVVAFVGQSLVAPVALIGLTLVYFDQRVRKEALDLQLLLQGRDGGVAAAPVAVADVRPATEGFSSLG